MKSIWCISAVMLAILATAGVVWFPCSVRAQSPAGGEFNLSQSVHWGNAVLPTGRYIYSVESGGWPKIVLVKQVGGSFAGAFVPMTTSPGGDSGSRGIVLARIGEQMFVTSLHLADSGLVLNFSAPNTETESQDAKRTGYITISKNPTQEFFRVLNPGNEKVSLVEAEKVYLAACETIEREFNRSTPIRPRLILHLGANQNLLHYPDREIRLTKWDKNRFAEAVVDLVLHDMFSAEERLRLSKLAVTQAAATVSLCELKECTN